MPDCHILNCHILIGRISMMSIRVPDVKLFVEDLSRTSHIREETSRRTLYCLC